ncbi:MAG: glycosyltransferase family 4 protein [Microcoleaceae cyanobacterium]
MKIGYLVNQYPKVSHSFIRREILALEKMGVQVARFSVRDCASELVDANDQEELGKTQVILQQGIKGLAIGLAKIAIKKPLNLLKSLKSVWQIGWKSERGILLHLIYLAEACVLLNWLKSQGISHIHAHFGTNSTTVALFCHILDNNITYSFTVHGPEEFDKPLFIALPEKIKHAQFVIAISSYGRSQLYRWCDYEYWSKIFIVHCALDDAFLGGEHQPVSNTNKLVCVGRLSEQKGQLLLLDAIAPLVAQGIDLKLILVGDGEMRTVIEQSIDRLNLQNHVEITGWASNDTVKQHILDSRALVLPSFAEGLPVVLMEALALSRPVITTYIAGIPELVVPGESGWLVPAGDVASLTVAIQDVLNSPVEKLAKMGMRGRNKVSEQHNLTTEVSQLMKLFQQYTKSS